MAKLAELEQDYEAYTAASEKARASRHPAESLGHCKTACEKIDGAIKYAKRKVPKGLDFLPIKTICELAPALFEHDHLLGLQTLIKSTRPLSKHEEHDFPGMVAEALEMEGDARLLWNALESCDGMEEAELARATGVAAGRVAVLVAVWAQLGVVRKEALQGPPKVSLRTRMDAEVLGVCPSCNVTGKGKKEWFCGKLECPRCKRTGVFHIVPN